MRLDLLIDNMHLLWVLGVKITVRGGGVSSKLVMIKVSWLTINDLRKEKKSEEFFWMSFEWKLLSMVND